MKLLTMYLPQFYRTRENDEWWGEGFTDWVSTRSAIPLFNNHAQPRIPLNGNYYDLMNKRTMQWQAELMHRYGIDGMCMYHYWFKDGRRTLEKPAENLLKWLDVKMPFCFYWANEPWARSWSNLTEKNVWANTAEIEKDRDNNDILLEQNYGGIREWKAHFEYILPFFKDKRYITIDEKPLFLIYRTASIPCLRQMLDSWRKWAEESNLPGLYVIGADCDNDTRVLVDAELYHEPKRSIRNHGLLYPRRIQRMNIMSYDDIWNIILSEKGKEGIKTYYGGFVRYDDSPRRGAEGNIIIGETPEKFENYMKALMRKNAASGAECIFVNAWNEWGEGMYLEPDEENSYAYLEALKEAKLSYKDGETEKIFVQDRTAEDYDRLRELKDRIDDNLHVIDKWMEIHEERKSLSGFIKSNFKGSIAIYGYGILGRHFYRELSRDSVNVKYVIDQDASKVHVDVPVYHPDEVEPNVDHVIVTSVYYFNEIRCMLEQKGIKSIVSLKEIINLCRNSN